MAKSIQVDALRADRPREWRVVRLFTGDRVILRHFVIPAPGEDVTDDAPQIEVPWATWLTDHDAVYGLTVDGRPTVDDTSLRQAVQRLRATANASPARAMDSTDAKAILRIFKEVRDALPEGS
jgi:hypothetical protein